MEVGPVFTYTTTCIQVQDQSQVGEARRAVGELARTLQMSEAVAGSASIIATELATNIVNHGGGGKVLLNPVWKEGSSWIDIIALDTGPGMENVSRCLADGYSTMGTAGNGLGAVQRMASVFDIVSMPGEGTAILARVHAQGKVPAACQLEVAAVNLPKQGEMVSGDAWAARFFQNSTVLMLADGLGHGISAADASQKAIYSLSRVQEPDALKTIEELDAGLRATRGAAVAVAAYGHVSQNITYCGVGNISGQILSSHGKPRNMISQNGIVGTDVKRMRQFTYNSEGSEIIMMHSDGLLSTSSLAKYPGIYRRNPALIAAILYRDYARGTDDASVVVAKK